MSWTRRTVGDGLTSSGGLIALIKVVNYAALPAAGSVPVGTMRYVQNETGSYLTLNKRKRGWYESDGVNWKYAGDNTRIALDALYDNTSSGLSAGNVQDAIDEVEGRVDTNDAKVSADGSVDTHSDVDTTTSTPSVGDALVWDGSNWVPGNGGAQADSDQNVLAVQIFS